MQINIFNSKGGILPRESIVTDGLSPERRERLDALYAAAESNADAEREAAEAERAQSAALRAESDARQALNRVFPPTTFFDNWKREFRDPHEARRAAVEAGEE